MKRRFASLSLAALLAALPLFAACGARPAGELPAPEEVPEGAGEELPEELPDDIPEEENTGEEVPEAPLPEETPEEDEAENEEENGEEEDVPAVSVRAQYIRSHADGLNVRTGAGTGNASLGQVNAGDMLHFVRREGGWYETRYRGRTAYVSANGAYTALAFLDRAHEDIERIIEEGLELLGVPYVYGATRLHDGRGNFLKGFSTNAFDCSSLMQYIFYRGAGILLDVTTRTQVKQGVPVTWSNIARGDLLFFTNAQRYNKTGTERIGHVALYLGENYILHTASDYAVIEEMSPVRQRYFITARRFL